MTPALCALLAFAADPADLEVRPTLLVVEMRSASAALPALGERVADVARRTLDWKVVGASDARRSGRADVDAAVADCAGDPTCVAKLGAKVGAEHVLVVAVSQLGDVIVALQRVNVAAGIVEARIARPLSAGTELGDDDLRAWLEEMLPQEAFVLYGTLTVRANVPGARVFIDGRPSGQAPLATWRLEAPHLYQVRVTKPGHKPFGASVDLKPGHTTEIVASLPPRIDERPIWRRPWFWVVTAAVLGAGAVVGAELARPERTTTDGVATITRGRTVIKVCAACNSTWAGGLSCEDCGASLHDPFEAGAGETLPRTIWRYIRLQYGARRGMIVRVLGILLGPVVAALVLRQAAGSERPWSILLALLALPAGFGVWYALHTGASRAVKIWVLRRGQLNRRRLARALVRRPFSS